VAVYPDDGTDIDQLMRHADVAMYQAKNSGRTWCTSLRRTWTNAVRRLQLENDLRHAVERDELLLHYQPRSTRRTARWSGVESAGALDASARGPVIPPADFIPIAEETGLIVGIGAWVIDAGLRAASGLARQGLGAVPMSINLSALQLRDGMLTGVLRDAMTAHGVVPSSIEIEITESTLMDAAEQSLTQLRALKSLGVQLSIDDFGTGYSSLNYLNRFPIDKLKIDRSFVHDMLDDPTDLAIVRAIVGLGHTLGLRVVAEGVESVEEAAMLQAAHCDELQGYLIAKPMPAAKLAAWIAQDSRMGAASI
jgi:EAL domain-containing protein (putative c-di-GMP-specific phosphodiesterase class I)